MENKKKSVIKKLNGELTQEEKIEQHLQSIILECKYFFGGKETGQIEHDVFEIREHLKNEEYE